MTNSKATFTKQTIRQTRKDGSVKVRELTIPSAETKLEHWKMLRLLYRLDIPMPHATGAVRGKNLLDNVRPHRDNTHFYMTDLSNAFGSVDISRLAKVIKSPVIPAPHRDELRSFVSNWATTPEVPGLPLGAPASPFLFNLACLPLDRRLSHFCRPRGIAYTRYLDDLTFSSPDTISKYGRRHIRDIVHETTGMTINHAKSQVHSLQNGPVTITGVSLYPDRHLAPTPALLETASQTFRGIGERAIAGELVYEDEIGQLHGYFGAVEQLSDPQAMVTHRLYREYRAALGSLGIEGGGQKRS